MSIKDLTCPYCDYSQNICHDDGFGFEEGCRHEVECEKCEKLYQFETSVCFYYASFSADCLNTENHDYKQSKWYKNKIECSICGDVTTKDNL